MPPQDEQPRSPWDHQISSDLIVYLERLLLCLEPRMDGQAVRDEDLLDEPDLPPPAPETRAFSSFRQKHLAASRNRHQPTADIDGPAFSLGGTMLKYNETAPPAAKRGIVSNRRQEH